MLNFEWKYYCVMLIDFLPLIKRAQMSDVTFHCKCVYTIMAPVLSCAILLMD